VFKMTADGSTIQRLGDGAFIPADPANADYQTYLQWVADGNRAADADPLAPAVVETPADPTAALMAKVGDEVVGLLIAKGQLSIGEFSPEAQSILKERQAL
jgi:hypothetical protein